MNNSKTYIENQSGLANELIQLAGYISTLSSFVTRFRVTHGLTKSYETENLASIECALNFEELNDVDDKPDPVYNLLGLTQSSSDSVHFRKDVEIAMNTDR